jgi:DNA-binding CsgD family transcriptional regulator/PAS domain-containing protein
MDSADGRLIAALYEGLTAPDGWTVFLRDLRRRLGAAAIDVSSEDHAGGSATAYGIVGIADEFRDGYDPRYVGDNPWLAVGLRAGAPALLSSPAHDPPGLEQSDYYRNWLLPQDLRYMAGCVLRRDGARVTHFSVLRGRAQGPFPTESLRLIERLRPHLCQATALTDRLAALQVERDVALTALDARPEATLLAEPGGRIVYLNRAAEALLPPAGALFIGRDGRLGCRSLALHRRLAAALRRAGRPTRGGNSPVTSLAVPRRDAAALRLLVQPLAQRAGPLPVTRHLVLLTLVDPQAVPVAPAQLLRDGLGLSAAESRLAAALAGGERLADYAARAGIGRGTARTLLRRAMAKTGARSQADLVRQVVMLAGGRTLS